MRLVGTHPRPLAAKPRLRCPFRRVNRPAPHRCLVYGTVPGLRDGFDYGYDANSNRLWRANLTAQALDKPFDELYRYDRLNRLIDFQRGTLNAEHTAILGTPKKEQTWNLDPTGNWSQFTSADNGVLETDQTRISNPANEITEISSWFPPGYDHAGNMTRIPKLAAPQEGFLATWDAWNRMVKLIDAGTSDTVQENTYNGYSWCIVESDFAEGELVQIAKAYYSSKWQLLEEYSGESLNNTHHYLWGLRYIDDLVHHKTPLTEDSASTFYSLTDAQFSATSLIASDLMNARFAYQPYGKVTQLAADYSLQETNDTSGLHLYCGYRLDNAGLYAVRNRFLDVELGSWLSRDIIPFTLLRFPNLYQYGNSTPPQVVDPLGRRPCDPATFARGLADCRARNANANLVHLVYGCKMIEIFRGIGPFRCLDTIDIGHCCFGSCQFHRGWCRWGASLPATDPGKWAWALSYSECDDCADVCAANLGKWNRTSGPCKYYIGLNPPLWPSKANMFVPVWDDKTDPAVKECQASGTAAAPPPALPLQGPSIEY